jgi:predicted Zn-dependent protease with MMP-like domain
MDRELFEQYVAQAVEDLPDFFREKMNNIDIVVESRPSAEILRMLNVPGHSLLLGLYQGVPMTKRGSHYGLTLPDKITIFQDSIERLHKSERAIVNQIRSTIMHEIAHHFGIGEDRLREIESENRKKPG